MLGFGALGRFALGRVPTSGGPIIAAAVGVSSGVGGGTGVGRSNAATTGVAAGLAGGSGVGAKTVEIVGAASGVAGSASFAVTIIPTVGAGAGVAVGSGTGRLYSTTVGASSGAAASSAVARSTAATIGVAAGLGVATGYSPRVVNRLSASFRNEVEAQESAEVALIFATITHPELYEPICVVSEGDKGYSTKNGKVVNYRYDGRLYLGCPFGIELLTDDERPPTGKVTIPDIQQVIGIEVLPLVESPKIKIEVVALSDFSDALDADNARNPIGDPHVEYEADYLFLSNVSGDAMMVEATLTSIDYTSEPWPKIRTTQDRLPGLYL